MSTNIPLTGNFQVTCEFKRKGNWAAGFHTGIDLYSNNQNIYGTCNGVVSATGFDKSYGKYIVIKDSEEENYHWFCHLSEIYVIVGEEVSRTKIIGKMGSTGNSTGTHLHFEIRQKCNCYGKVENPADYMRIPNKVGMYNTSNYQIVDKTYTNEVRKLKSPTYLRNEPTVKSSKKILYIGNTTVIIQEKNVKQTDGYSWDKVKIKVTGQTGYMINSNYK